MSSSISGSFSSNVLGPSSYLHSPFDSVCITPPPFFLLSKRSISTPSFFACHATDSPVIRTNYRNFFCSHINKKFLLTTSSIKTVNLCNLKEDHMKLFLANFSLPKILSYLPIDTMQANRLIQLGSYN